MHDLIIIGSGPAGLSAAIYAKRSGLDLLVLEGSSMSGGQVLNTYEVDNYLGMPGTNGFDMGALFRKHADKLGVNFRTAKAISIEDLGEKKIVHTKKEDLETRTVILASGAQHAKLNVPGEEEFTGRGVSYCATCDGAFYEGRTVAVVGGGDVALEDAVYLARTCEKVYLIHRRDTFRGTHVLQEEIAKLPNVEILYNYVVKQISGKDMVESIDIEHMQTQEKKRLSLAGVFLAVGIRPNTELVRELVDCDDGGYVIAGEDCKTSRPGIFAAGDVRKKPLRQIITAAADGANAASSAAQFSAAQFSAV